ncbi:hypothetical protein AUJ66_03735 [Candidatus Desantisbacteria bacterium CG1_02_38_46]|uniref:Peptidase A2 domain-containing protein n=3 Tax=unclassified Candidatus Desantisiibacteriota TaxID=3106372 RepID=A0A2H9PD70_9BACT|nr:MAG: hypothetical protein AUJ66_03735 [Candidatus Desantisbacteria bacterium CG1_02_38_46]PIU51415.1 MAG: hypothetical protein COS91_04595 [Candidatus Desantisbacteria bacterium CG07_land_8_20_14_0_80_39_15]PIZ17405.1 MAG: hypothetical protein COY51_00230 [Candidatus Desantisbacteria bacterium CG_4_10_14_0_8_um_filter_39_17]
MRPLTFPYISLHGKHPLPIIPLELKGPLGWKETMAYVDSGASFSIFSINEAHRLGIDYITGKEFMITVGDGSSIPVYLHRLSAKISRVSFKATIGFSPRLGVGFNLLGRKDVFERFDVTFSDSRRIVIFSPLAK